MGSLKRRGTAAALGSGVALGSTYGFLVGEAVLARRTIGVSEDRPPNPDGVYGDDMPGRTISCLVLGDSAAVGYGMERADATPPAMIGLGLAHVLDAPIHVRSVAVVGAQTSDVMEQVELSADHHPDIAVIIVGTNDVTHQVSPRKSARQLARVVHRLRASGAEVVVGTCPDLGTIRPILQPLRSVARHYSRRLAKRQMIAVVEAGGRAVSLGGLLGTKFEVEHDQMFGTDKFHPSESGYANLVSVLIPAMAASIRERDVTNAYADATGPERDLMSVADAAAEAIEHDGTQVVKGGRTGRLASVLRRRPVTSG